MQKPQLGLILAYSGIMRKAVFGGLFYEKNPTRLASQLKDCFGKFGEGAKKAGGAVKGCIVPHAGYAFSGACAASAYRELAGSNPDTYIIIGLSHHGYGTCLSKEDWETPLGVIKTDVELVEEIRRQGIGIDEQAHAGEHSIEVQLPFLQYIHQGEDVQIVALIASQDMDFRKIAGCIQKARELKRRVVVIASSDFTHYGRVYGYCPFRTNIKEGVYKLDKGAIERILQLDADGFLDYCSRTEATICGKWPIATIIELCKKTKGRLVKYCTSAEMTKDYENIVGYASMVFE